MTVQELAPAKINLALHVTGRRDDGYHLLDSLVVFARRGDVISAQPMRGLSLSITGPEGAGLSAGADNLVLRAARLIGAQDLALQLDKHLPVASGIGGGSADAAACLRLIARLQDRPLPDPREILALGADVPVCLESQPCRMRGIGEQIEPLRSLPRFAVVMVNPRRTLSTPEVFGALTARDNAPIEDTIPEFEECGAFFEWLQAQRNDLQDAACRLAPEIVHVLEVIIRTRDCGLARMSGSGATCFGLYPDLAAAQRAAEELRADHPQWWVLASDLASPQLSRATT